MRFSILFNTILMMALVPNHGYAVYYTASIGTATLSDGTVAYREVHQLEYDGKDRLIRSYTDYNDPNGSKIAHMETDYTQNRQLPTYLFLDTRNNYREGLRREGGVYWMFFQDSGKPESKAILEQDSQTFSSQAWSHYLSDNLKSIAASPTILRLVLPSRQAAYEFILNPRGSAKGRLKLELAIKNIFLRLFAPSFELEYDATTTHLMRYEGLSNVADKEGKYLRVTIDYTYSATAVNQP